MDHNHASRRPGTAGLPLLNILSAFPIAFFTGALATDIAYAQTANMMWADFSAWLLAVGEAGGFAAALIGLIILVANRRLPRARSIWPVVVGCVSVLVIGFFNNLVHSRDAWTSVVPTGLTLSAVTVVLMLLVAWVGFAAAHRAVGQTYYAGSN